MSKNRSHLRSILKSIFARYTKGKADIEERQLVDSFYDNIPLQPVDQERLSEVGEDIKQEIDRNIQQSKRLTISYKIYIPAAACFIILFSVLGFYFYQLDDNNEENINQSVSVGPSVKIGREHFNDLHKKVPKGSFFEVKDDEEVLNLENVFRAKNSDSIVIENTSIKKFTVLLSDGSKVRLSPESRVSFGADFNKNNRLIHASGEVFFNVATQVFKSERVPFIVHTKMQNIEVLGTQFLVDSGSEVEESVQLQEGRIKLMHNYSGREVVLHPRQQAFLNRDKPNIYIARVGEEEKVNAWRNGLFYFEDETIGNVMRELSIWYDVDIRVDNSVFNKKMSGTFTRYELLSEVLELIELTNKIRSYEKKGVVYVNRG